MTNENIKSDVRLAFLYEICPDGKIHSIASVAEKFKLPRPTVSTWANEDPNDTWIMQRNEIMGKQIIKREKKFASALSERLSSSVDVLADSVHKAIENLREKLNTGGAMSPKQITDLIHLFDLLSSRLGIEQEDNRVIEGVDFEILEEKVEEITDINQIKLLQNKLKQIKSRDM